MALGVKLLASDVLQQPKRRALLGDSDAGSRDVLSQHLQAFNLDVVKVSTCEQLIEELLAAEIEIVVINLNLAEIGMIAASIHLIRGSGQSVPILSVADHLNESDQASLRAQDCRLLWTPIDSTRLKALIAQCLQQSRPERFPTSSDYLNDAEQRALQRAFIEMLNSSYLDDLRSALEQQSARKTQAVLHKLKGSAGSFGFHQLGMLAASAERLLRQGCSLDETRTQIDPVIAEAERLQQLNH